MSAIQTFRHYLIAQDPSGGAVEVWRSGSEVVCLAVDTLRQIFVELHVGISDPSQAREHKSFQQIAQQASLCRHPNLLSAFDCGEDEGANYYVTEFVDGERLDTYLARCNPLPTRLALMILSQSTQGLQPLAQQPSLLAGVNLFNSTIQLLGDAPQDLLCKIADLSLTVEPSKSALQLAPTTQRIIGDAARLLYYMMTGSMVEADPPMEASQRFAPEVGFLLTALTDQAHAHHPASLEQLHNLAARCLADLNDSNSPLPKTLPTPLRPRLPLQSHFLAVTTLADLLNENYQVDASPFDSAQPYRHAATTRDTRVPATVQLLPPERLMPHDYLRSVRTSIHRVNSLDHPHLLRVILLPEDEHAGFFLEEAAGNHSLASMLRLKGSCNAGEAVVLLEHLLEANRQAEACGLTPCIRSLGQIHVQFTATHGEVALPDEATLARISLSDWPSFRLRVRTYPTTLNLTQPERFNLDRLLPQGHPGAEVTSTLKQSSLMTPASVRDFALLAAALTRHQLDLPDKVRQHISDHLRIRKSTQQASPKEFVERLAAMAGRSTPKPPAARKTPAKRKASPPAAMDLLFDPVSESLDAGESGDFLDHAPASLPLGLDPQTYNGDRLNAPGFAEMLFGDQLPPEPDEDLNHLIAPVSIFNQSSLPFQDEDGRGFLEGTDPMDPQADEDYSYLEEPPKSNRRLLLLLLLVILVAALVAGIMAHFTGRAFWLSK